MAFVHAFSNVLNTDYYTDIWAKGKQFKKC